MYGTQPIDTVAWPPTASTFALENGVLLNSTQYYLWIAIVGGIIAFTIAWGIGANDVANAFATSVGSGAIRLRWAVVLASVMELAGACLIGALVTHTLQYNIINQQAYDPNRDGGSLNGPELLMLSYLCALIAATVWLALATALSLPVSATHATVGALVGVGLCYDGAASIQWFSPGSGLARLQGVVGVLVAWLLAPVLAAVLAVIFFLLTRTLVLRRRQSRRLMFIFRPLFYGLVAMILLLFILYDGLPQLDVRDSLSTTAAALISVGVGAGVVAFAWLVLNPLQRKGLVRWEQRRQAERRNNEINTNYTSKVLTILERVGVHVDVNEELSSEVKALADTKESFEEGTEHCFTQVQVMTAALESFAHGASDVGNAVAPFAAILSIYQAGGLLSEPLASPTFESAGTYSGGGALDGQSYAAGDVVPDGGSFCGEKLGVSYVACAQPARFAFLTGGTERDGVDFSLYDNAGKYAGERTCFTNCNLGNSVSYSPRDETVPLWILFMGGCGIIVGLLMWGYRVILSMGSRLTKLTPSRGCAIEMGSAVTTLASAGYGLPVSTTSCKVGASIGLGVAEFQLGMSHWRRFVYFVVGWAITVLVTGALAAAVFAFAVYSPTRFSDSSLKHCPGPQTFVLMANDGSDEQKFAGVVCSGLS